MRGEEDRRWLRPIPQIRYPLHRRNREFTTAAANILHPMSVFCQQEITQRMKYSRSIPDE